MVLVLAAIPIFASDAGGHDDHHITWLSVLGKVVNSGILFGGLYFLLRKPIKQLMAEKSQSIKDDILKREELLEKTTVQLEEMQKRVSRIEDEVVEMKKDAKRSGNEEKERIEELGKKEAQRIVALTEEEIDNKVDASVRNLKEKIAQLTIDHFKDDFKSKMDKKAQEKIIDKNIDIIGDIIERE